MINNYYLLSGGALGTDTAFDKACEYVGIPKEHRIHFYAGEISQYNAPNGNTHITQKDYEEGKYMAALAGKYMYGYPHKIMKDVRLIRNWSQVKYADAVFAIGKACPKGFKAFPDQKDDTRVLEHDCIVGGTGYAVAMALLTKKPIYVFDLITNQWAYFNYEVEEWQTCKIPKLTNKFAGIGTRQITNAGIQAISDLFTNTFGEQQCS